MALGLKRGVVELAEHDPGWEIIAAETIGRLWRVFGSVAKDIQHVGSTAIRGIKAKPIIDIAVAVEDFRAVERLAPELDSAGFIFRMREGHKHGEALLFAVGDYSKEDSFSTHYIHIVEASGGEWQNLINFRDYLNAMPKIAAEYESIKVSLAIENPYDPGRKKYSAGKQNFIEAKWAEARIWDDFGRVFTKITPITKGWSEDKKYCVTQAEVTKFLLRITPISRYETRKALFETLERVAALGIPMCRPVKFGTCSDGVYSLQTWIDGEDLEIVLPRLPEKERYILGFQAGEICGKCTRFPPRRSRRNGRFALTAKRTIKSENTANAACALTATSMSSRT